MYCKNCGKEIKDGVHYCPVCGKPTGVAEEANTQKNNSKNKKTSRKLLIGIAAVFVLLLLVGIAGKNLFFKSKTHGPADNTPFAKEQEEGQNPWKDKKWAKKKSYKNAYEEEYHSFEKRVEEYCAEQDVKYIETVDEYAEQIDKAYKSIEKAVPGLSEKIAKGISSNADSEFGAKMVEKIVSEAIGNEEIRKTAYKATITMATSLFQYLQNETSAAYPFGFELLELKGDYALLRSAGTYDDMWTVTKNSMLYDIKLETIQERIANLEDTALQYSEDTDAFAECMGRIAANRDRENEVKELFVKCMTNISCGGNAYCYTDEIKLYWVVHKDGTVYNAFWAPAGVGAEDWDFNISMSEQGSCFLEADDQGRFVIDRTGKIIFEGNSFTERSGEPAGESIICTYGPSGNALRETKAKNSTSGTYYVMELAGQKGKAEELLEIRELLELNAGYQYEWGIYNGVKWKDDMTYSDYALLKYISLENQEEEVVIDLSSGETYFKESFEESVVAETAKAEKNAGTSAKKGMPEDGWGWNAYSNQLYAVTDSVGLEWGSGLSSNYVALDMLDFNIEAFLKNIDESREISAWYCKEDRLWIVTRSGYFYTYDLESRKKSREVEIGENTPYCFTPYGLMICGKNKKGDSENAYEDPSGEKTEYSVYQYDASGKQIAKYPAYSEITDLTGYIFGFIYYSGKDSYNLAAQDVIGL